MTVWYHLSTILGLQHIVRTICLGLLCVVFSTMLFFSLPAAAAPSSDTINFSARLKNSTGGVVPDGYYNIGFRLYSQESGGAPVWSETYYDANGPTAGQDNRVRVVNGYFNVKLGSQTGFSGINWQGDLWLTMNIGGVNQIDTIENIPWDGEMTPRIQLSAVPYAMNSKTVGGKSADQLTQLGQGTQTDNSNNASIAINKTGSGDLLHLQSSGVDAFTLQNNGNIVMGSSANQSIAVATNTSGGGRSLTLSAGGSSTGSNQQGGNLILQGGAGDGSGANGGVVIAANGANSTNAFTVQNASGDAVLSVDTVNKSLSMGGLKLSSGSDANSVTTSLWGDTTPGWGGAFNDQTPITLGLMFTTTQPGSVSGVRFYNPGGANPDGADYGRLWACTHPKCSSAGGGTGTVMAEVHFAADDTQGWKEATFSEPVTIAPGVYYMISYYSASGWYPASSHYFDTNSVVSYPLYAPGYEESNGRFAAGSSFPSDTWQQTNYWVDVLFETTVAVDSISSDKDLNITPSGNLLLGTSGKTVSLQGSTINLQADTLHIGKEGSTTTVTGAFGTDVVDAASVGTLVIGGNNATAVAIEKDTSISGSVTMRNEIDSANALQVQNASGDRLFSVNTANNTVQIGTADSGATLLVLDTKTSEGDPTGTNGAMYYNSAAGKFRCFENNAWKDCVTPLPLSITAGGTPTTDSTTPSDVTDMSFDLAPNTKYSYKFVIMHEATENNYGAGFGITAPANLVTSTWCVNTTAITNEASPGLGSYCGSGDATITTTGTDNPNNIFTSHMEGYIQTGNTAGKLQLRFRSETTGKEVKIDEKSYGILQIVQ